MDCELSNPSGTDQRWVQTDSPAAPVAAAAASVALQVTGCTREECSDARKVQDYFPGTNLTFSADYPLTLTTTDRVFFPLWWCTKTQAALDANLLAMKYVFTIDGVSYSQNMKRIYYTQTDPTLGQMYCSSIGGAVAGWQPGRSYRITYGYEFTASVNDGWDTYPAGHDMVYQFTVNPNGSASNSSSGSANNSSSGNPTVRVSKDTNCRTGPGDPYPSIGSLMIGETAEVVGRSPGGDFWIIKNPDDIGGTCWLWTNYATVTGGTSNLPVIQPPPLPDQDPRMIVSSLSSRQDSLTITLINLDPDLGYSIFIDLLEPDGTSALAEGGCESPILLYPEHLDAYDSYGVMWTTPPCTAGGIVPYWGNIPSDPDFENELQISALEIYAFSGEDQIADQKINLP
jgi:hypothetical protein